MSDGLFRRKYKDRHGNVQTSPYWWGRYTVQGKEYKHSLGVRDRNSARSILVEEIRRREREAAGLEVGAAAKVAPLGELIDDYTQELSRHSTAGHVRQSKALLRLFYEPATVLGEVEPKWIERRLRELEDARGWRPQVSNRYRTVLSAFGNWLVKREILDANPLQKVDPHPVKHKDPKFTRRPATMEELRRLTTDSDIGEMRQAVYLFAATTGLRQAEMRRLLVGWVDLEQRRVWLPAKATKNREEATIPLPRLTVERIRPWVEGRPTAAQVFDPIPTARTYTRDLQRAGIEKTNAEGTLNFHALRVTYCVFLALSGCPEWLAVKLMRHKDPALTSSVYARFAPRDARAAVDRIDLSGLL